MIKFIEQQPNTLKNMINLINYTLNALRIPIYITDHGDYIITDDDWTDVMAREGAISEEGYAHGYIYDMTAGDLSKYIHDMTGAEYIHMTLEGGAIRELKWNKTNRCYYGVEDDMII